jgi:hypothetical protein
MTLKETKEKVKRVAKRVGTHAYHMGKAVGKAALIHAAHRGEQAVLSHVKGRVDSYFDRPVKRAPQFHKHGSVDKMYRPSL